MEQRLINSLEPLGGGIEIFVSDEHKFGTDAVLLADFAEAKRRDRAADLGTGCGIIPFLWCRNENKPQEIFGIELQENAAKLAQSSAERNRLCDTVKIINSDIRELYSTIPAIRLTRRAVRELRAKMHQREPQGTKLPARLPISLPQAQGFCRLRADFVCAYVPRGLPKP